MSVYRISPRAARAIAFLGAAACAAAAFGADGPAYYRMKPAVVIDRNALLANHPAVVMMLPVGWVLEGTIAIGDHGCLPDTAAISWRAHSPDGKLVIEGFPNFSWQFSDDPQGQRAMVQLNQWDQKFGRKGCPVNQPVKAADFLQKKLLPAVRPGKEVAAIEPTPDLNQVVKQQAQRVEQQAAQAGARLRILTDTGRARLKYEQDGQPVEEWVTAVILARQTPAGGGQQPSAHYDNTATMLLAMRAPQGQLDANERLLRIVRSSIHLDPEWQHEYVKYLAQINAVFANAHAQQRQIIANLQQQAIGMINATTANMMAGSEVAFKQQDQLIRGVETYRDPATGQKYELSNQYGHAWLNGNNEYVLSDDPNFNPNGRVNGSWTALEHAQPSP